jgi:hypothetical protein
VKNCKIVKCKIVKRGNNSGDNKHGKIKQKQEEETEA